MIVALVGYGRIDRRTGQTDQTDSRTIKRASRERQAGRLRTALCYRPAYLPLSATYIISPCSGVPDGNIPTFPILPAKLLLAGRKGKENRWHC